ncbi:MAG: TraR/DksA C4-type zinc finger protein [Ornithinimicrobium sp.]
MDEHEVRAQLEAKRDELVEQRAVLTRPQQDQGSISFGKRVGDGTAMAVDRMSAVTAHDSLGVGLKQVQRALDKLDEGTYGFCDECEAPIGDGRLEARPSSTRCVKHG